MYNVTLNWITYLSGRKENIAFSKNKYFCRSTKPHFSKNKTKNSAILTGKSEGRVVCYYTNWSVYRPGTAKFNPQNINPYLCTHLIYAFGGFTKDNALKTFDKYQDIEQGGYAKFNGLKTFNKELKTILAIGGWNEVSVGRCFSGDVMWK